ncbi:hypothetical protein BBJ28_00011161 [Nothophytophthora sp. Chile5]|nr:hypothetical protein BBJ28_00011161 [Nothophytophthora sp. Chile5]
MFGPNNRLFDPFQRVQTSKASLSQDKTRPRDWVLTPALIDPEAEAEALESRTWPLWPLLLVPSTDEPTLELSVAVIVLPLDSVELPTSALVRLPSVDAVPPRREEPVVVAVAEFPDAPLSCELATDEVVAVPSALALRSLELIDDVVPAAPEAVVAAAPEAVEPEVVAAAVEPEVVAALAEPEVVAAAVEPEVVAAAVEPEVMAAPDAVVASAAVAVVGVLASVEGAVESVVVVVAPVPVVEDPDVVAEAEVA